MQDGIEIWTQYGFCIALRLWRCQREHDIDDPYAMLNEFVISIWVKHLHRCLGVERLPSPLMKTVPELVWDPPGRDAGGKMRTAESTEPLGEEGESWSAVISVLWNKRALSSIATHRATLETKPDRKASTGRETSNGRTGAPGGWFSFEEINTLDLRTSGKSSSFISIYGSDCPSSEAGVWNVVESIGLPRM
jgi:hypothetical protein